ncbi:MAG: type II toxin-antitoxin system PemK/MazF family toxin [Bryobacter sp.]|nr:type II toxin-antitoxin system PemK/MazF family toxin [Bryobacter sp.]
MARATARGDVRLFEFKPPGRQRRVVVLTRNGSIGYLSSVTVAPITSTNRGVPS